MKYYRDIRQVVDAHRGHFFDKFNIRFFNSKILPTVYRGQYFITSERFNDETPRMYTIRQIDEKGNIETIGDFQQYKTIRAAIKAIEKL